MASTPQPSTEEIDLVARCIADGIVQSTFCLPRPELPLALLIPPAGFGGADYERIAVFAIHGVNSQLWVKTSWGWVNTWETCKLWPRSSFETAVTLARVKSAQAAAAPVTG
jgi:hypothetical protein